MRANNSTPLLSFHEFPDAFVLFHHFYLSTVIIVGLVVNMACVADFLTKREARKNSMMLFASCITIADCFVLGSLLLLVLPRFGVSFHNFSRLLCKSSTFLSYFGNFLVMWLVLALTAQRSLTVVWPSQRRLLNLRRSCCLLIAVLCAGLTLYSWLLHYVDLIDTDPGASNVTSPVCELTTAESYVAIYIIHFLLAFTLPLVGNLMLNILMVRKLRIAKQIAKREGYPRRYRFTEPSGERIPLKHFSAAEISEQQFDSLGTAHDNLQVYRIERHLTVQLIIFTLVSMVLNLPSYVSLALDHVFYDPEQYSHSWQLFSLISGLLFATQFLLNFLFYVLVRIYLHHFISFQNLLRSESTNGLRHAFR